MFECVRKAVQHLLPQTLKFIKQIRSFDYILPQHQKAIYGEFEREYQRQWPGNCKSNSYAALNWQGYVYVNEQHSLVHKYCNRHQHQHIVALLMHEVYHIISNSNRCRNRPECLIEHETLAALVEHSHRNKQLRLNSREVQHAFRNVFKDYIVPLVPACKDRANAKQLHNLMLRTFMSNCRRRQVLDNSDNSFDLRKHFNQAVAAGLDHFSPQVPDKLTQREE